MASGEQQISIPQSSFSQQGQLDWVALSNKSVSFTVDVLGRFMTAGINPLTIIVGQEVARSLRLSQLGQRNIQDALDKLASYGGIGDTLWFGFGLRTLPRILGSTDEGKSLLALCASLGECFHEDVSALVMSNLVKAYNPPSAFTPSSAEWQRVIKACSGTLSVTKFPLLLEGFTRLSVRRRGLLVKLESYRAGSLPLTACPSPEDMATALIGLTRVSMGHFQSITIEGGVGAAWIAAVAEWLYGLTVLITDSEGNVVYTTVMDSGQPQIRIRYGQFADGAAGKKALALVSKTYKLYDHKDIMKTLSLNESATYGGRLAPSNCLSEAYGLEFMELMQIPNLLGIGFGCAARIFKGVVSAEVGIDQYLARRHRNYFSESYGRGFISNSIKVLPELEAIRHYALDALQMSFQEAQITYNQTIFEIRKHCCCNICIGNKRASRPHDSLCLLALFETIIVVCQVLSGLTVTHGLGLRRSGLEWFYVRVHYEIMRTPKRVGAPGQDSIWKTEINRILESPSQGGVLQGALRLFTGRGMIDNIKASAVCESGICVYYNILQGFTIDREILGRAMVIPGQIECGHKRFPYIEDQKVRPKTLKSPLDVDVDLPPYNDVSLSITETTNCLQVDFVFCDLESPETAPLYAGPHETVEEVLKARGLVNCDRSDECLSIQWDMPLDAKLPYEDQKDRRWYKIDVQLVKGSLLPKSEEYKTDSPPGKTQRFEPVLPIDESALNQRTNLWFLSSKYSNDCCRAATILINSRPAARDLNFYCILADDQCLSCCLKTGFLTVQENSYHGIFILPCQSLSTGS